ncbi:hypothetical protein FRX31_025262 [Thalictrum thalictroides]|uniref:Uncharacterized protein n=1 Tax=Thalictrum thalictroides TaxID=46969 RepID=A0A7J6VJ55_THATH|nr:hypothetical protein FRX31_025262 [Thalictrum thalictroides]
MGEELQITEAERAAVRYQLKPLILMDNRLGQMLKWEKNDSINRQRSQGKLFRTHTVCCERVVDLCLSEQELSDIVSLMY